MCLGNISGDFSANNMKKTGLNGCVYNFSINYRTFNISNIIDIHKYLMKKHDIKQCLKNFLVGLLTGLVNGSNHTKCISLSNQKCMIQSTLIILHSN